MKNIVLQYAYSYGIEIIRDVTVSKWDNGYTSGTLFVGSNNRDDLTYINWRDLDSMGIWMRPGDGVFNGCTNRSWYITEAEAQLLIDLNAQRAADEPRKSAEQEREEAKYEKHFEMMYKAMDDDIYPYC